MTEPLKYCKAEKFLVLTLLSKLILGDYFCFQETQMKAQQCYLILYFFRQDEV